MCALPLIVTAGSFGEPSPSRQHGAAGAGWEGAQRCRAGPDHFGRIAMPKSMHETQQLAFDGAVDADGHILEPPDLWERYIDPQYRDRALRIVRDEQGLEELEIGGKTSAQRRPRFLSPPG